MRLSNRHDRPEQRPLLQIQWAVTNSTGLWIDSSSRFQEESLRFPTFRASSFSSHTHTHREIIWTRFCEILCHSSITSQWIVQMGATETPTILTELSIEAFKTGICETSRSKRAQVARCNTNYNCLLNQILPGFSREGFFEGPGRKRLKMYTHSTVKRRDGGLSKSFSTEFLYPKYE